MSSYDELEFIKMSKDFLLFSIFSIIVFILFINFLYKL